MLLALKIILGYIAGAFIFNICWNIICNIFSNTLGSSYRLDVSANEGYIVPLVFWPIAILALVGYGLFKLIALPFIWVGDNI